MHVITIGGATQDIFLTYQGADSITIEKHNNSAHYMLFESGEKIEVDSITYVMGGGATNSALSFQRQGFNVSTYCKIGSDHIGDFILKGLSEENINTSFVSRSKNHATGQSFIVNSLQHERTIFAYRGANNYLDLQPLVAQPLENADLLYITSLSNESATILPELVACAEKLNIPIAINPGSSQLTKGVNALKLALRHIKTLILNSSEAHRFIISLIESNESYKKAFKTTKTQSTPVADDTPYLLKNPIVYNNLYFSIEHFFQEILDMGPEIVVITNGANGVYAATKECIYFHPSIKTDVIDTVGAGDAFGSCFVGSIAKGYSIEDSLRLGIINSASVLQYIGAKEGLLREEELNKRLSQLEKNLLQRHPQKP